ncbi:hypothetical protein RM572_26455 [Streptomyces sp. DSM 42041]|uniref:Uncharacterized protein n=1 Tax=Streptomyces hazeniae TaxID=3075538 RepID=A0ABU2NZ92_9ACTN|nr:hypothetical protein [Streptomyces sp. DSM 42041]MDT0382305.1 hypothetical protein [Streptomyces sp. DSM 42041]
MNVRDTPCTLDARLAEVFLALAEQQLIRVREAMAPERDIVTLSAGDLRFDAQWLEAALEARNGYRTALDTLLDATPTDPEHKGRPVHLTQHQLSTTLPTAAPARPVGNPGTAPVTPTPRR